MTAFGTPNRPLDTHGRLAADVSCRSCGFNLRGLGPAGDCPECGTAIQYTLKGDRLAFSDPAWVATLAAGMGLLAWTIITGIVLGVLNAGLRSGSVPVVELLFNLVLNVLYAIAVWKLTTPEPGVETRFVSRDTARWGIIAAIVLGLPSRFLAIAGATIAGGVLGTVLGLVGIAGVVALFIYARRLALRLPDEWLAKQTKIVLWGSAVAMSLAIITVQAGVLFSNAGTVLGVPDPAMLGVMVDLCPAAIGLIVFGIWATVLAFQYRSRLRTAAKQSLRNAGAQLF